MTSNNLDFVARCMIGHNTKDIKSLISEVENIQNDIGGVKIVQVTKEDYDALTDKPTNVIYLVSDGDKITLYIGGTEVNVQSDWTQTITTADDYIKNKPTLGTAAAKNATDTYNATGTDVTTGKAVAAALATLPEPMVFKGSLGTGGTITTLPTASSSNKGYVYKVITAGIYANLSAKVGDTFISDGSTWVLIPSGDEPSGTVTNVAVANGGGLTVSGSPITSSGTITVGHSNSVTAKTSSSVKKFTYDAYGHVTGSSELSTAESNALASGIDSTKVAQIETNKNNISLTADQSVIYNYYRQTETVSQTGVTVNSDGTITVNVNNTSDSHITLNLMDFSKVSIPNGDYYIYGCPPNGSQTTYRLDITRAGSAAVGEYGEGKEFNKNSTTPPTFFRLVISPNTNVQNKTFKPMFIPKSVWDAGFTDYQPYAMSNAELTVAIQALQAQLANQ